MVEKLKEKYPELIEWDLTEKRGVHLLERDQDFIALDVIFSGVCDGESSLDLKVNPDEYSIPFEFRFYFKEGIKRFMYILEIVRNEKISLRIEIVRGAVYINGRLDLYSSSGAIFNTLLSTFQSDTKENQEQAEIKLNGLETSEEFLAYEEEQKQEKDFDPLIREVRSWDLNEKMSHYFYRTEHDWAVLAIKLEGINNGLGHIEIQIEPSKEYLPREFATEFPKWIERFYSMALAYRKDNPSIKVTVIQASYHRVDSQLRSFNLAMFRALQACFLPIDVDNTNAAKKWLREFKPDDQLKADRITQSKALKNNKNEIIPGERESKQFKIASRNYDEKSSDRSLAWTYFGFILIPVTFLLFIFFTEQMLTLLVLFVPLVFIIGFIRLFTGK